MADAIANFALRGSTAQELGAALGSTHAEYVAWHGQAAVVAKFSQDARVSGVNEVLTQRIHEGLQLAEGIGVISWSPAKNRDTHEIAEEMANHELVMVDQGVKVAAIVMLHNASEQFLWRLVRFGLVANRERILKWIGNQKITVEKLIRDGRDASVDALIEKWWDELERDSLPTKWERLVALVSYPPGMNNGDWHFDKSMLVAFDEIRHEAVHHNARAVANFDLDNFATQHLRAVYMWLLQIASVLQITIPAGSLFRS